MKKEIELKYRFAVKSDFDKFMSKIADQSLVPRVILQQENYFFDTENLSLYSRQIVVRVRKQNKNYFLCAKFPQEVSENNNLFTRGEEEREISQSVAQNMIKKNITPADLPGVVVENLILIGSFKNKRVVYEIYLLGHQIKFEFDDVTYVDGHKVFELEIELASPNMANLIDIHIRQLLLDTQIKILPAKPKSARVFMGS